VWYPFLFPSFFISVRLCFCGKCLSFPAMCQNNPLPNTRCGSRNRACPSQESTSLSRRHRLHAFFLMNAANFVKIKQRHHFNQDISCFTLLNKQIHEISFEHFTLKQDVIAMKTSLSLHIVSNFYSCKLYKQCDLTLSHMLCSKF
jgi:hypothetical protein